MTQNKLITITRRDLPVGYQAVQASHSTIEFQYEHPKVAKDWIINSKYLIFLTVENEEELYRLKNKASEKEIKYTTFHEPDINNQLTAITLEPGIVAKKLTNNLPLLK